ncbi:MAG TPA: sulfurtransferase [Burkholderiaceae bacterium]|nr:sulfurtransferase [Burkholderiaceae bacterium]
MNKIFNISAYRFVSLPDAGDIRTRLRESAELLPVKGTILLAEEGINLVLAGPPDAVRELLAVIQADPRLAELELKESWSATQPFGRMVIKVKREIIRMNEPAIRPAAGRAPAVDAMTLKRWLDQGHDDDGVPVVMLDTRNAFEVDHGAFADCIDWRLGKFSDFPAAADQHRAELAGKTVVSYCTGGIRCEKAAIHLRNAGLERVYQLDGGILRYFEHAGASHYRGTCFVFDEREALAPDLSPAGC